MAGGSTGCEHEPNWKEIFPVVAKPEDSQEKKEQAARLIRELKPKCQKLLMNSTACYGCESNPVKEHKDSEKEALRMYMSTIVTISEMVDAARFGLLKAEDITSLEFMMMRILDKADQSRRIF